MHAKLATMVALDQPVFAVHVMAIASLPLQPAKAIDPSGPLAKAPLWKFDTRPESDQLPTGVRMACLKNPSGVVRNQCRRPSGAANRVLNAPRRRALGRWR